MYTIHPSDERVMHTL